MEDLLLFFQLFTGNNKFQSVPVLNLLPVPVTGQIVQIYPITAGAGAGTEKCLRTELFGYHPGIYISYYLLYYYNAVRRVFQFMGTFYEGFDIAFWVDYLTFKESNCSTLLLIAVTNLFLSFLGLRLVCFSLAGFNSFLSSYGFILIVVLLQELAVFLSKYHIFILC